MTEADTNVTEKIKSFLIVGETLDGIYSFEEVRTVNLLTFLVLLISSGLALVLSITNGTFWWLLFVSFFVGAIYYLIIFRVTVTYAITKYRIIRLENDIISRLFFGSSRLVGFTDLHYEHVESINVGSPRINMFQFYISLVGISAGWVLLTTQSFGNIGVNFINLLAVMFIVAGIINTIFSLPFGGVRLLVQSISGETMEFPEAKTPTEFIDDLILNCRTFLSYGAN